MFYKVSFIFLLLIYKISHKVSVITCCINFNWREDQEFIILFLISLYEKCPENVLNNFIFAMEDQ